ncbi:hypothetical protein BDZ94DRAFT_1262912 [Collybia nuda]|uniref:Uncharacterized protein n=1 Tax=Collybia nuda TaxID=64659 RepID=A0A9P5Y3U4_9AGAR|nr:hypothetical protein BDZ94DRAFT_1262912 [Collybia nuda]
MAVIQLKRVPRRGLPNHPWFRDLLNWLTSTRKTHLRNGGLNPPSASEQCRSTSGIIWYSTAVVFGHPNNH